MAYKKFWLVMLVLALVFGMTIVGCNSGDEVDVPKNNVPKDDVPGDDVPGDNVPIAYVPPEDKPVADRWGKWVADDSTATLDYSVDNDGVCKITVGGIAMSDSWKASAQYQYTAKVGAIYDYTFEAWTESDYRELDFSYNTDNDEGVYFGEGISLTNVRKTYTVRGQPLSKGAEKLLNFQCAKQLGTFYVKIIKIEELKIGRLTITNFAGNPGIPQNSYVYVDEGDDFEVIGDDIITGGMTYLGFYYKASFVDGVLTVDNMPEVKGNTIIIPVWDVDYDKKTVVPYTGNKTVAANSFRISYWSDGDERWIDYNNKVPITFTNGNATINFGTQMEYYDNSVSAGNLDIETRLQGTWVGNTENGTLIITDNSLRALSGNARQFVSTISMFSLVGFNISKIADGEIKLKEEGEEDFVLYRYSIIDQVLTIRKILGGEVVEVVFTGTKQ